MTARTVSETEAAPASWPALILAAGEVLGSDRVPNEVIIWRRIESWIARRWPSRSVVYIAEGPGWWAPRLYPFTVSTTERWDAGAWVSATLDPTPYGGLELPGCGPYRITGTAGDDAAPPADLREAAQRLHDYSRGIADAFKNSTAYYVSDETQAPVAWAAKAIHLSGAADLLRPYRRQGAS